MLKAHERVFKPENGDVASVVRADDSESASAKDSKVLSEVKKRYS